MSTENPFFSYTNRDYEGSRKEGLARIPILSKGLWTDLNAGDPGVVLLDYMHALADLCNYYLDHQAQEMFIATSKERVNLFRLAQNVSYLVRSSKGAKVDVRMYLSENAVYDTQVIVPKYTELSSNRSSIKYLTLEDVVLTDTQISYTVPCSQGEFVTETYTGTGTSSNTSITDESLLTPTDQSVMLQGYGIDADTVQIVDSTGAVWTPVDHLIFVETPSKVYQKMIDTEHRVTIKFGNGVRGYSPKTSDLLTITYVDTLGDNGKITSEALKGSVVGTDTDNVNISVNYYNPYPSTGGSYGETDEELRNNIMSMTKTLDRAVTREDYEKLVKMIDGVRSAVVYDVRTAPDLCLYHEVKVVILPEDSVESNQSLINEVKDYLDSRSIPPTNIVVKMPTGYRVPVTVKIKKVERLPAGEISASDQVTECIREYFNSTISIGEVFNPFTLTTLLNSLSTVKSVLSITPSESIEIPPLSIATLGALSVVVE